MARRCYGWRSTTLPGSPRETSGTVVGESYRCRGRATALRPSSVRGRMVSGVGVGAFMIRGPEGRRAVAVAEQQVGRRPSEEGEPVGGDPVGEGGQEGVAGVNAGQ